MHAQARAGVRRPMTTQQLSRPEDEQWRSMSRPALLDQLKLVTGQSTKCASNLQVLAKFMLTYLSMSNVREAGNTRAVRAEPEKHSRETEVLRFTRKG